MISKQRAFNPLGIVPLQQFLQTNNKLNMNMAFVSMYLKQIILLTVEPKMKNRIITWMMMMMMTVTMISASLNAVYGHL